jgi:hypothetical protein
MSIVSRVLIAVAVVATVALPVAAQRGATGRSGGAGRPPNPSQARVDTTRKTQQQQSAAVALDFQEQDLRVVLDAIAAAGQLNVSLSNIPQQRARRSATRASPLPSQPRERLKAHSRWAQT